MPGDGGEKRFVRLYAHNSHDLLENIICTYIPTCTIFLRIPLTVCPCVVEFALIYFIYQFFSFFHTCEFRYSFVLKINRSLSGNLLITSPAHTHHARFAARSVKPLITCHLFVLFFRLILLCLAEPARSTYCTMAWRSSRWTRGLVFGNKL